jgi:non-specific serine/threonine protein kinase
VYGQQALALCRRTNQRFNLMRALQMCAGDWMHRHGDYAHAQCLVEEWLSIARELGDIRHEGVAQFWLGVIAMNLRDFERALHHHAESLRVMPVDEVGTRRVAEFYQAVVWWLMGDETRALAQCETSLAHFRATGFVLGRATALHTIGDIALFRGDLERARDSYIESLRLQYPLNTRQRMVWPLAGLAAFLADVRRPAQALSLWEAANALRASVASSDYTMSHAGYVRRVDVARAALSAADCESAERLGKSMGFDQTVAYALAECG